MRRDVFQAIADPVRRDIIDLLTRQPMTVSHVAEKFNITRPAVSKHLKILSECGIIGISQKGRERYCEIRPAQLVPAFMWVDEYRSLWGGRIDSFEKYLKKLKNKKTKRNG